jgi:hypothetical protein
VTNHQGGRPAYICCDSLAMHQDGFEIARLVDRRPKAEHLLNFIWFTIETKPVYIYSLNDENS